MARKAKILVSIVSICALFTVFMCAMLFAAAVYISHGGSGGLVQVFPALPDNGSMSPASLELLQKMRVSSFHRGPFTTTADERTALIEMLNDERYVNHWREILIYIGLAGESDLATSAIIEYATKNEDVDFLLALNSGERRNLLVNKALALTYLGFTRGNEANDFLRKSISDEGVVQVTERWIHLVDDHLSHTDRELIYRIAHACAATELVLTQEPENVKIVRDWYTKTSLYLRAETNSTLATSTRDQPHGAELNAAVNRIGPLIDAMALNDLIHDIGIDEYKRISMQPERRMRLSWKYGKKYSFDY
ncbi:MAG: hypothetical protein IID08_01655 [Candidatus Hydrogenedentes bacterium]|nr:hypothetical protein [Candidatus Hydrogenedentota bacterium]